MGALFVELLPIVIAAAIVPGLLVLVILILQGKHAGAAGFAFVAGAILMRLAQGILFGALQRGESDAAQESTGAIKATLLLVLAILLLVTGVRMWLKGEDPDAPPPKWMESVAQMTPGRSFLIGLAAMTISAKQWVFTLAAVQTIGSAQLTPGVALAVFTGFVLVASLPLLAPVILRFANPAKATTVLQSWRRWLDSNYFAVKIVVSLGFGLLFLWNGLSGLMGS